MYIYVQARDGTPLMPTQRADRVRRLLRDGNAVIVSHAPFIIRLTYDSTHFVQPVSLGVDAGSVHVGLSATTNSKELLAAEIELRTDIVDKLSTRREVRQVRRSKRSVRYRAPRFNNRCRPDGWLAPSIQQKVHSHVKAVRDICKLLPVASITVEVAQFDIQKIKDPDIAVEGYQHGVQDGFWNVREYVLWRDGHKCQCCHGKSNDKVLNVHHIESRKTGGDSPANLITLCETCHKAYHTGKIELKLKRNFQSLRDAAAMNIIRWSVYNQLKTTLNVPVHLTYGYKTKLIRIGAGLEKGHAIDARCISGHQLSKPADQLFIFKQLRRHNRKVMKSNMLAGGRWKRNQIPREIKGFRLFDTITYNSVPAYIHGRRTSGYFDIKDTEGKTLSNSVSYKKLKLKRHNNKYLFITQKTNRPILPTDKSVGFLGK